MKLLNYLFGRPVAVTTTKPQLEAPKLEDCAKDKYDGQPLVCGGCAHSAGSEKFPGRPSGERPCFFCVRNTEREAWIDEAKKMSGQIPPKHPANGVWYNGTQAMKVPMDCYQSCDMLRQSHLWNGGSDKDILIT